MNISSAFLDLKGRYDIDLGVEHIFFPGGYAKQMTIPAGHVLGQHKHNQDHESMYSGHAIVRTDDYEIEVEGAGSLTIEAHKYHQVEAVGPLTWWCIWETDETDPEKIDTSVIEE